MIDGTKNKQKSVSLSGHNSDRFSVVLVRAKPYAHKGYVTESLEIGGIVPKLGSGAWKIWSRKLQVPPKGTPEVIYLYFSNILVAEAV